MSSPAHSGMRSSFSSFMRNLGRGGIFFIFFFFGVGGGYGFIFLITSLMMHCLCELSRFLLLMCLKKDLLVILWLLQIVLQPLFGLYC